MTKKLEAEFLDIIDESGSLIVLFNIAQELVQEKDGKEAQALNIIVGSSFALMHALNNYKEVKYGKSVKHGRSAADSKNGSGSGGSESYLS